MEARSTDSSGEIRAGGRAAAWWGIAALAVSSVASVILGFFTFQPQAAADLMQATATYIIAGLFVAFVAFVVRLVSWPTIFSGDTWRRHAVGVLLVLLTAVFLISREPAEFKVLMDEVVLAAAGMGMHFDRDPGVLSRGHEVAGVFLRMETYLDKRPVFFPFLLSITHDLIGYRVENSFLLNRLLTFGLCGLLYGFSFRLGGRRAGALALCLLASIPLVAQNASGGGMELLHLVMLLTSMHLAVVYLHRPGPSSQSAFVLALVLLAFTRYEAGLYALAGAALIFLSWWRSRRVQVSWTLAMAPMALIPLALQHQVFALDRQTFWQLKPGETSPFGLSFLPANLADAYHFLLVFSQKTYSSPLVAVAGLFAVALVPVWLARLRRRGESLPQPALVLVCFACGAAVVFALVMCYGWADLNETEASRFALPVFLMAILFAALVLTSLARGTRMFKAAVTVILTYLFVFSIPASARRYPSQRDYTMHRMAWCLERFKELPTGRYLVVSPDRLFWAVHRISAIQPWSANYRLRQIRYHMGIRTFDDVLVVQKIHIDPVTREETVLDDSRLVDAVVLEALAESSFRPFVVCRLSRVRAIEPERGMVLDERPPDALRPGVDMAPVDQRHLDDYFRRLP